MDTDGDVRGGGSGSIGSDGSTRTALIIAAKVYSVSGLWIVWISNILVCIAGFITSGEVVGWAVLGAVAATIGHLAGYVHTVGMRIGDSRKEQLGAAARITLGVTSAALFLVGGASLGVRW